MKRLLLSIFTVLLLTVGTAWADTLDDGYAADKRGDYAEALRWYRLAAAQGDARAQFNLGYMYHYGQDVTQDYVEAVKWVRLAAAQGLAIAQNNLGTMYDKGQGVTQDYVRAHMWLNLSAVSGNADAVKNRDIVARKMTSQPIAQAQMMARDCQQKNFKGCE